MYECQQYPGTKPSEGVTQDSLSMEFPVVRYSVLYQVTPKNSNSLLLYHCICFIRSSTSIAIQPTSLPLSQIIKSIYSGMETKEKGV